MGKEYGLEFRERVKGSRSECGDLGFGIPS